MHKSIYMFIALIGILMLVFSGSVNAKEGKNKDQKRKTHIERMQLEKSKKKSLAHCKKLKSSSQKNYKLCESKVKSKFAAEVLSLQKEPEKYFKKKEKHKKISKK